MSDASISIAVPAASRRSMNIGGLTDSIFQSAAEFLRKRWVYQSTLAELENYSARSLRDIGADRGIEEFARRAARL